MTKLILVITLMSAAALAQQQAPPKQFIWKMETTRKILTLQDMTPEERQVSRQHGQYLMSLQAAGKLSHAIQIFDPNGLWGVIVLNVESQEEANALLKNDPFMKAGIMRGEAIPARLAIDACVPPPGASAAPAK